MEFLTRLEVLQRQNDLLANQLSQTVSDAQVHIHTITTHPLITQLIPPYQQTDLPPVHTFSFAQELPMEMAHLMDEKDSLRERAMQQGDKLDELVRQMDNAQGLIARLNR